MHEAAYYKDNWQQNDARVVQLRVVIHAILRWHVLHGSTATSASRTCAKW